MKILYITPFVQHPVMKTSFRHYYFLRELARRHDITLLTPTKSPVPEDVLAELRSQVSRLMVFDAVRPPRPNRSRALRPAFEIIRKARNIRRQRAVLRKMRASFRALTTEGSYDLVLFHGRSVFPVIDGVADLPVVLDFCDATSTRIRGRMQYSSRLRWPLDQFRYLRSRSLERRMARLTPHLAFISCRDRDAILGPESQAAVIPNAVDSDYWRRSVAPGQDTLVFHGGMDYRPNVDAAIHLVREVLPRLHAVRPDLELLIVGRDPLPELLDVASGEPRVTVTGAVPDVRPFLERATVYAAPIRFGAGQQNKLLEAMAMEIPVVTSSVGEAGLRVGSEEPPVVCADDVDAFADAILGLLTNPTERARLAAEGRAYIVRNFAVDRCVEALEALCMAATPPAVGLGSGRTESAWPTGAVQAGGA